MKRIFVLSLAMVLALFVTGCGKSDTDTVKPFEGTVIALSDEGITVDGAAVSTDPSAAVYTANDIVYYEEGKDFTYGEGTEADAHSAKDAAAHTVLHITQPGDYALSGKLSAGQVAIDLGDGAEEDPAAVVNLYLDGVDITCTVAPAIIFYNVYECGSTDAETASKDVDTSAAGANVYISNDTYNIVNGSYVARIYKPDSVELSEDGTEVLDAKKLHKYDGAFYSKQTMNIYGDTGRLDINAANEGLDSELHLTINGGTINIVSGNDGINTNEDGVSVTTINGGTVNIRVAGETGEGDGIDSNGWLVINGGTVVANACSDSQDSGIDSDMGIHINGGTVVASGRMLDRIEDGGQNYAVFTFTQVQAGGSSYTLKNADASFAQDLTINNDFSVLLVSSPDLKAGDYALWQGETQLSHGGASFGGGGFGGGMMPGDQRPDNDEAPKPPEGMELPEGAQRPKPAEGEVPEKPKGEAPEDMMPQGGRGGTGDMQINDDGTVTLPDGTTLAPDEMQQPDGGRNPGQGGGMTGSQSGEASTVFPITTGGSMFSGVSAAA